MPFANTKLSNLVEHAFSAALKLGHPIVAARPPAISYLALLASSPCGAKRANTAPISRLTPRYSTTCFRGVFIRPAFVENRYLNHPYYEPVWAELETLGVAAAVHSTPGLWNPEWTSHGPFIEKVKGRLTQIGGFFGAGGGPTAATPKVSSSAHTGS